MPRRIAFIGFRHGHILSLYDAAVRRDDLDIVAACEEHAETRAELLAKGEVEITHTQADAMLRDVDCDIVAVGDTYARRARMLLAGLDAGCHVIADKPLCARIEEVDDIARAAAARHLQVGCMLTMRDSSCLRTTRRLLLAGAIGEVHAVHFGGQHPLLLGSRPAWYFEKGEHGGTINDIGIHAIDAIPWATGRRIVRVEAARCWNAFATQAPHFGDGAQMMLTLDNGAGVLGDVSYFAPDVAGYTMPFYWRMTFWGREGVLESGANLPTVHLLRSGDTEIEEISFDSRRVPTYLDAFLDAIDGREPADGALTTIQVLTSARQALEIQAAGDQRHYGVDLD